MTDDEIFAWAGAQCRWLLTENVRDFRPILLRSLQTRAPITGIVFTSSRSFPRSRKNPGSLIRATDGWLRSGAPEAALTEDWLTDS